MISRRNQRNPEVVRCEARYGKDSMVRDGQPRHRKNSQIGNEHGRNSQDGLCAGQKVIDVIGVLDEEA